MDPLGQVIRNILNSKKMSSADLGKIAGLSSKTIDNVIYGKSRKKALLETISTALGVNLTHYVGDIEYEVERLHSEVNLEIYSFSTKIVIDCAQKNGVFCTKEKLDLLIITLYDFLIKEKTLDIQHAEIFCKGMIEYGIKNLLLSYKSTESIDTKE